MTLRRRMTSSAPFVSVKYSVSFTYEHFYRHACEMGDILHLLPGAEIVALSGSVARKEPNPADIDLILLHDGHSEDFRISLNKRNQAAFVIRCLRERGTSIIRLWEQMGCLPTDISWVNKRVLTDCGYLRGLCRTSGTKDPDFYKTVFCEIPLLSFDIQKGKFIERTGHKLEVGCCQPRTPWPVLKQQRLGTLLQGGPTRDVYHSGDS